MPQTMLISVVLPAPLGPSRAKISPRRMSRSIDLSAWKLGATCLPSALIEMMGCMRGAAACAGAGYRRGGAGRKRGVEGKCGLVRGDVGGAAVSKKKIKKSTRNKD